MRHVGKTSPISLWAATVLTSMTCLLNSGIASPSQPTVAEMQWHRRVLIISAPRADNPAFNNQLRMLGQWNGGDDRDVTVVRVVGLTVTGSRDTAQQLRDRYQLANDDFSVTLVGKDGHVALRSQTPLSGVQLEGLIDSMPMRKSGQR